VATPRRRAAVRRAGPRVGAAVLKAPDPRHSKLPEQTPAGILVLSNSSLRILDTNTAASSLTGYSQEELLGMGLLDLFPDPGRVEAGVQSSAVSTDTTQGLEAKCRRKDGSIVDLELHQRRLDDGRIIGVLRDTSQEVQAKVHLAQMLSGMDLFAATIDLDGKITYANPALSALTGWSTDELVGCSVYELLSAGTRGHDTIELALRLRATSLQHPLITKIVTRSGVERLVAISATLLAATLGEPGQAAVLGHDVTEEHALRTLLERELEERLGVDAAIGRLEQGSTTAATALAICRELRSLSGVDVSAVIVFDSDQDATVLGIEGPDNFFLSAGARFPSSRASYLIQRARLGPWAERWLQRSQDGRYGSEMTTAGMQSSVYAPIHYGPSVLGVLAVGTTHAAGEDAILAHLPTVARFGVTASALLALDLQVERVASRRRIDLGKLIHTHAYTPVFQPIVDLASGEVLGYEALTRFLDGERPDIRLAAAWSAGIGPELELAMLSDAIALQGQLPEGRWLNVNVSPRLLDNVGPLREILVKANRPLVLEITEHEVITDYRAFKEALSSLGPVRTAVDDTGSGIANFAHILELRPDFVKLDIGLIRGIDSDPARQAVVLAMCHFTLSTGSRLIAEGVETRGEADTVRALGVGFGQGYWYGRPQPIEALLVGPSPRAVAAASNSTLELAAQVTPGRRASAAE